MGLFSKTKRTTTNQDNRTVNDIDNNGEFAGVGGDVTVDNSEHYFEMDASDNSVDDHSYHDNSVFEMDASDNSVFEMNGDMAGNNGTITMIDGGSFDLAESALASMLAVAESSNHVASQNIEMTQAINQQNTDLAQNVVSTAGGIIADTSQLAITEVTGMAREANGEMATLANDLNENFMAMGEEMLSSATQNMGESMGAAIETTQLAMERNAKLIQTSNLQGQDLLIEQSGNMTKWLIGGVVASVTIGGVAMIVKGCKS